MKTIGYIKRKHTSQITDSPWGFHIHGAFLMPEQYPVETLKKITAETGVKWARVVVHWSENEKAEGKFDWRVIDQEIDSLQELGIKVFITIYQGPIPAHYENAGKLFECTTYTSKSYEAFPVYVKALVEHFAGRVQHYQLFNEPGHGKAQNGWPAEEHARLILKIGDIVHGVDKDLKFMVYGEKYEYTKELLAIPGVAERMDVFNYHHYDPEPEKFSEICGEMRRLVHEKRPGIPFWCTECGYASSGDTIHGRFDAPWGLNIQAKLLLRNLLTDLKDGIEKSFFFSNVEFYTGCSSRGEGFSAHAVIQHTTWQPKPSYYAYANLAAVIDGSWKKTRLTPALKITHPGCFFGIGPHEHRYPCEPCSLVLRREDALLLAYWLPWRAQELIKPARVQIRLPANGISFKEPVLVDLMTGEVFEPVSSEIGLEVPLADYPFLLTERSALEMAVIPQQPTYDEMVSRLHWKYDKRPDLLFKA